MAAHRQRSSPALPSPNKSPLSNPFETTFKPLTETQPVNVIVGPNSSPTRPVRSDLPTRSTSPLTIRPNSPTPATTEPLNIKRKTTAPGNTPVKRPVPQIVGPEDIDGLPFPSNSTVLDGSEGVGAKSIRNEEDSTGVLAPARDIAPSLATLEKAASTAIFFETLYHALLRAPKSLQTAHHNNYILARERRRLALEEEMIRQGVTEEMKSRLRMKWQDEETMALREKRRKVGTHSFAKLKTIGHGEIKGRMKLAFPSLTILTSCPQVHLVLYHWLRNKRLGICMP